MRRWIAHSRPSPAASAARRPAAGTLAAEPLVEPVGALEDRPGAGEAGAREHRRDDPRVGRPPGVEALGPGAVRQVLDDPARLAAAEAEGGGQLRRRQPEEPARGRCRAEGAAERGGMEAAPMECARTRAAHRGHDLHAGDDGRQHLGARGVTGLPGGDRRGHAARSRMDDRVLQRVVVVEPVRQRAVGQDCGGHPDLLRSAPETRLGRSAEGPRHRLDALREVVGHRGQGHAGRVQEQAPRLLGDGPGHRAGREPRSEGRQRLGKGLHRSSRAVRTSPYHGPRGAVKEGASGTLGRRARSRFPRPAHTLTEEAR